MIRKQALCARFSDTGGPICVYLRAIELKQLFRQGWLRRGLPKARAESVADHTFGVILLAALLASATRPELNLEKVMLLALSHDLGEVYAGDIVPDDQISPAEKLSLERRSLDSVLAGFAGAETLSAVWEEYENGTSAEAIFVREIDRLEMAGQALMYEAEADLSVDEFLHSAKAQIRSPANQAAFDQILALRNTS